MTNKLIFIFILLTNVLFSQKQEFMLSSKNGYNVEVKYTNDSIVKFNSNKITYSEKLTFGLATINFKIDGIKYNTKEKYKDFEFQLEDKSIKKINKSEIKEIKIKNIETEEKYNFKKVTIKSFDRNLNLIDEAKDVLLPIKYEDEINLLGYSVLTPKNPKPSMIFNSNSSNVQYLPVNYKRSDYQLGNVYVYLNSSKDNVAFNLYDNLNLFNSENTQKRIYLMFKEIYKDCQNFPEYEEYEKMISSQKFDKKEAKEYYKEYEVKSKEIKKKSKDIPKNKRQVYLDEEYEKMYLSFYIDIIEKYKEFCN